MDEVRAEMAAAAKAAAKELDTVKHEAEGDKNEALEVMHSSMIEWATRREDDSLTEWNEVMSRKLEERDATHLVRTAKHDIRHIVYRCSPRHPPHYILSFLEFQ